MQLLEEFLPPILVKLPRREARGQQSARLRLDQIRRDGGTQPRSCLDLETVADYAAEMERGAEFPLVTVFYDGASYWLADGFHRYRAAEQAGCKDIACHLIQGTQEAAQWYSFSANKANGLRRTNDDKQRAVQAALQHPQAAGRSDQQIARHVGVSAATVGNWREKLSLKVLEMPDRTVTRNGTTYQMSTAAIGRRAAELAVSVDAPLNGDAGKLDEKTDETHPKEGKIVPAIPAKAIDNPASRRDVPAPAEIMATPDKFTTSQRAMAAAKLLAAIREEKANVQQHKPRQHSDVLGAIPDEQLKGKPLEIAARLLNVGRSSIQRAGKVLEAKLPEVAIIERGGMTVEEGYTIAAGGKPSERSAYSAKRRMVDVLSQMSGLCEGLGYIHPDTARRACTHNEIRHWADTARKQAVGLRRFASELAPPESSGKEKA